MLVKGLRVADVVAETWRPLAGLFVLDVLVTAAYVGLGWHWITPGDLPLPLLGTGLAVFLGLRNNLAYARWWEARTLWGAVVNNSRSFARSLSALMPGMASASLRRDLVLMQIAWVAALRCGLRREDTASALENLLEPGLRDRVLGATNVSFAIQHEMAVLIGRENDAGRLPAISTAGLNTVLGALADAQGGLERIRNTPMPRQYAAFPRLFVAFYCLLLPFGIVPDLNLLTPIGSAIIGFLFLALDVSGRHLEDPFARSAYDIPMSAITRTIEIDLRESLDDEAPAPLRPVRGILR